ncbi:MAG: hypothetical protein WD995_04765 [Gemmatimonadota bacterium]
MSRRAGLDAKPQSSLLALVTMAVLVGVPCTAEAQQARGWVGSSAQLIGMRPVVRLADPCPSETPCYTSAEPELAAVASQDLFLTAWGFGVRGLSTTLQLRTRQRLGGGFEWPRSDDPFDAMLAYADLVRGDFTFRLGRQEVRSGLGFPSFDGGMVRWTRRSLRVEGYGGRSLARGLRDPANEALRGLEDFLPDQGVYLIGTSVRGRVSGASLTARYHREILGDRSGLASERASLDVSTATSIASVRGALDYDVARRSFGKGHVTVSVPLEDARWILEGSASRYVPYFSLSTIWGLFEPVSYSEGTVRVGWAGLADWSARASFGLRRYGDPGTVVVLRPLEDTGRRASVDVMWRPEGPWAAGATYDLEWGPGGYLGSLEGTASWTPSEGTFVTASGRTFQQIEQYRLGDGRAVGAGVSGGVRVTDRLSFSGGGSVLRARTEGGVAGDPWNQTRGWSSVRLLIGRDPGSTTPGSFGR